jgi:glycosyltransferase involved in cell wall biosynthesis
MHPENHISICVCTYKRPVLLRRLLEALRSQQTNGDFTYSAVIADNDAEGSSRAVVEEFSSRCREFPVTYVIEPQQNIARARNCAIRNASGNFIAFIDDDEEPIDRWLLYLFETCRTYDADGALGPVLPHFEQGAPRWVVAGGYYDRPNHPTGQFISGSQGRTGNVLFRKDILQGQDEPFRPEFRTGEDQDFFCRMVNAGKKFVWCHEAFAYESVPPVRWRRGFLLRRMMLRGNLSVMDHGFGVRDVLRSMVAISLYGLALPVTVVLGQTQFMRALIKFTYHLGRLLGVVGLNPIRDAYVTE